MDNAKHVIGSGRFHNLQVFKSVDCLEDMEIMKATTSDQMLNIIQNLNSLYQMLQPLRDQTKTSTD